MKDIRSVRLADGGLFRVGHHEGAIPMFVGEGPRAQHVNFTPDEAVEAAHALLVTAAIIRGGGGDSLPTLEELRAEVASVARRVEVEQRQRPAPQAPGTPVSAEDDGPRGEPEADAGEAEALPTKPTSTGLF
jgi:hypothetical protein